MGWGCYQVYEIEVVRISYFHLATSPRWQPNWFVYSSKMHTSQQEFLTWLILVVFRLFCHCATNVNPDRANLVYRTINISIHRLGSCTMLGKIGIVLSPKLGIVFPQNHTANQTITCIIVYLYTTYCLVHDKVCWKQV